MLGELRRGLPEGIPPEQNPEFLPDLQESHRQALLEQLPKELQERWADAPVEKINEILQKREKLGFKKIYGIHISPSELPFEEKYLSPGSDGKVHYTIDPANLYRDKVGRWMYIVEGTGTDEWNDPELGWKTSHAPLRVIERIPMDDEEAKLEALERYNLIKPPGEKAA